MTTTSVSELAPLLGLPCGVLGAGLSRVDARNTMLGGCQCPALLLACGERQGSNGSNVVCAICCGWPQGSIKLYHCSVCL